MTIQLNRGINLQNALRCKEFLKIINKACKKYKRYIERDELKQIKRIALWRAIRDYKKDKKCTFKTYLYYRARWICGNYLSKRYKIENLNVSLENLNLVKDKACDFKFYYDDIELLNSLLIKLDDSERNLIKMRFFERKTLQQLSDINGLTKQGNRIRIIQILKKMNGWCR